MTPGSTIDHETRASESLTTLRVRLDRVVAEMNEVLDKIEAQAGDLGWEGEERGGTDDEAR